VNVLEFAGNTSSGTPTSVVKLKSKHSWHLENGADFIIETASDGNETFNTNQLVLKHGGRVGIGTASTDARLHIMEIDDDTIIMEGSVDGTNPNIRFRENDGQEANIRLHEANGNALEFQMNGLVKLTLTQSGDLGVGTDAPAAKLDVEGRGRFLGSVTAVGDGSVFGGALTRLQHGAFETILATVFGGDFVIGTGPINAQDERVRINSSGMTVNGTTTTDILQITGGADLAEPFGVTSEGVEPGMVLSIDPVRPGKLRVSDRSYDRGVAGIASGAKGIRAGITLQQDHSIVDGEIPVALTGRVYCFADADFGPIHPGDLLTTSGTPGHAMKVRDHGRAQGAVLGKAMTSLESGRGYVLVLVSLQ
jgi:hypothetical protein